MKNPKTAAAVLTAVGGSAWVVNSWNDSVDPEWRDKVTKWDKNNNMTIVIPTDEGAKYVTMPVSWGIKPLKVASDYAYDLAHGKDKGVVKSVENLIGAALDAYNPIGGTDIVSGLTPTFLDTPVDIARNRSWAGSKIKPDWMPGLPKADSILNHSKTPQQGEPPSVSHKTFLKNQGERLTFLPMI